MLGGVPNGRPYEAGIIQSEIGRTTESVWEYSPGIDGHGNSLAAVGYERGCGRMARPFAYSGEKSPLAGLRLVRLSAHLRVSMVFILPTLYIVMVRTFKVVEHPLVVSAVSP